MQHVDKSPTDDTSFCSERDAALPRQLMKLQRPGRGYRTVVAIKIITVPVGAASTATELGILIDRVCLRLRP